jgi:hypothetical protein
MLAVVHVVLPNGPNGELSSAMRNMRLWLDSRRFEPSTFQMRLSGRNRMCIVHFTVRGEAEAFAAQFKGKVNSVVSAAR